MERSFESEIWRLVPPEEKLELMAKAQSSGVLAIAIVVIVASTVAIGLKMSWVMWGSLVCSPFVFQFAAGKAWRGLRPRCLLEYLAARSASRRYAFAARAKDLTATLIFKGTLERVYEKDHIQEALEAIASRTKETEVWVSLFGDAVVMISERPGGAECKFSHILDDKLELSSYSPSGKDYSSDKELIFSLKDKNNANLKFKLTSRHPAALLAFEKKMKIQQELVRLENKELLQAVEMEANAVIEPQEDDFLNLFSN